MPDFAQLCAAERARATGDATHVGAVCRFNRDDDLIVITCNRPYGSADTLPVVNSARLVPRLDPIVRLRPIRQQIIAEVGPLAVTPEHREVAYWEAIEQAVRTGQTVHDWEARERYQRYFVPAGLVGAEYIESARRMLQREARARVDERLASARDAELRGYRIQTEQQRVEQARAEGMAVSALGASRFRLEAERERREHRSVEERHLQHRHRIDADLAYRSMHGNTTPYPPAYVNTIADGGGGHAEEYLVRAWSSVTSGLILQHVDLFMTRMPCPEKSSGFRMGATVYKEGCINKFLQLVESTAAAVTWEITYFQTLSADEQALSTAYAASFPARVRFALWTAPAVVAAPPVAAAAAAAAPPPAAIGTM